MMLSSRSLKVGKHVEVVANGTSYRGILKGITATEIYLKSPTKTWAIPADRVKSIREVPQRGGFSDQKRNEDSGSDEAPLDLAKVGEDEKAK
jgi:hypothetical protein